MGLFAKLPEIELLDQRGVRIFNFDKLCWTALQKGWASLCPTGNHGGALRPWSLIKLLELSQCDRWSIVAMEPFFMFNGHLSFLLYKLSVCTLCSFFYWAVVHFSYLPLRALQTWGKVTLCDMSCKNFFRSLSCVFWLCIGWVVSFLSLYYFVFAIRFFSFNVVKCINLFLYGFWTLNHG